MQAPKNSSHAMRYTKILLLSFVLLLPSMLIITGQETERVSAEDPDATRGTWLDIEVDGVEVVRESQSNNIYPGQKVRLWVKLIHGSRPRMSDIPITNINKFTVILVVDDNHDNVTTMYKTVGNMATNYTGDNPVNQGPNPPFIVPFDFEVPTEKPEGLGSWAGFQFLMHATITVDDDDKSDNYRSGTGLRISEPQFEPVIVEEGEKDNVGPIHNADVGDPLDLDFILKNEGPAVDDIGINVIKKPEGWIVGGFDPITVYPNDEEPLALFVQIPSNPFLAQADTVYTIVVRAYSDFFPDGPYPSDSSHTFRIRMNKKPGISIEPDVELTDNYLEPGETHEIYFKVTNTGNVKDRYTLNTYLDEVHVKKGWEVSKPKKIMPEVKPGESVSIPADLTIPQDAAKFYNVNVFMSGVSSVSGGTYEKVGEPILIFASTKYAADIETPDPEGYWVEPGKENVITFEFTNMGNDKDPNQELVVDREPLGWLVIIDMTPINSGDGLGPRTTVPIEMTVIVPETAFRTDRVSRPKVIIEARGGPNRNPLDSEIFEFNIPPRQKVDLSSPEPEKEGYIGGQVDFIVNVRNSGNWLDTFNLSVDSEWAELEKQQVATYPGTVFPVKVSINVPEDAAADTNPDTPYPNDPEKNWYDGYKIRVSAYSTNETEEGATLKTIELILHVQPFYEFKMQIAPDEEPLKFSTDHDQNRAVKVKINNTGNIADLIKLDWVDNPHDWLRLQNTYIDLPDNEVAYAILNINPQKDDVEETGVINVTLVGISRNDPEQEKRFELTIEIEFYRMAFEFTTTKKNNREMEPTEFGDIGDSFSFQVNITNIGSTDLDPTRFDELYVVLYDGPFEVDRAEVSYLPVGESKEVVFSYTFATPGPHPLSFRLEGDVPISPVADSEVKKTLIVRSQQEDVAEDEELPIWSILVPVLLIIIFVTLSVVFIVRYNQIYISPTDTGYDEDGEYRPWAIKEKLKEEEKTEELQASEKKESLPEPEAGPQKPGLPPAQQGGGPKAVGAPRQRPGPVPAGRPPQQGGRPGPGMQQRPMPGARSPQQAGGRPGQPTRTPMPNQARPGQQTPRPPVQPPRPRQ